MGEVKRLDSGGDGVLEMSRQLEEDIVQTADCIWPDRDTAMKLKKLGEEYGELAEAIANDDFVSVQEECADVMVVVIDLLYLAAREFGGPIDNPTSLNELVSQKLDVIIHRHLEGKEDGGVIKIRNLEKFTSACPTQWEADTTDGRKVYVRYRWGKLRFGVGDTLNDAVDNCMDVKSDPVFEHESEYHGQMTTEEMLERTGLEVEER